jgi:hypothetical protein
MCNCTSENLEIPRCAIAHLRSGAYAPSRNDVVLKSHTFAFSRRNPPEFCYQLPALSSEGAGNAGRPMRPPQRVRRSKVKKHTRQSGHTGITRHSLRNGFNGFLRALPGDRAFLPPSPVKIAFHEPDASVGASGPHDFSVRFRTVRYRRFHVHRILPRVRDDREPPLCGTGRPRIYQ